MQALQRSPSLWAMRRHRRFRIGRTRWELRGPWRRGQPIHETMTRLSLVHAASELRPSELDADSVTEYVRGVAWNDDPDGLLFADRTFKVAGDPTATKFSWGLAFAWHFKRAEWAGRAFDVGEPTLLKRSHFGDLQFLHAMAPEGTPAADTRAAVMRWAEFTYRVSTGDIPGPTPVADVPVAGIAPLFRPETREQSVERLFLIGEAVRFLPDVDVAKRAAGSLLHMIQDSFATGHAERNGDGAIVEFHAYERQHHARHAAADRVGTRRLRLTYESRIMSGGPSHAAVIAGTEVLAAVLDRCPWSETQPVMERIFRLSDDPQPSGPGGRFTTH